ncbi:MAG: glutathione S-transferase N-terminal domain-containing protein [Woeseiaceae bacterium]|nr:glutathione S-transferase N-terminal domain-containing protein [Woeseiaceae bacterium]
MYKIIGAETSPYSVKVRSYLRFKAIPHEWIGAGAAARKLYESYFRIAVIPVVVTPDHKGLQNSTPIIQHLEATHGGDSIHPADEVTHFLSCLLEEFGDEWGNKWMFHYRWARKIDQLSAATRIACLRDPLADEDERSQMVDEIVERMIGRVWYVGSNAQNAAQIESGYFRPNRRKGAVGSVLSSGAGKGYDGGFESCRQCQIPLILLMKTFFHRATDCRFFPRRSMSCCGDCRTFPKPNAACF